jgi:predicted dehydrogenase
MSNAALSPTLSIGLIGCGRAAERYYLPALARVEQVRLAAVADPLQERRELIASGIPGCLTFTSAEELLEKANLAAIIVATPPATHAMIATMVLNAGIPVLVEKPLAPNMAGVKEVESIATSRSGSVMVGFSRRYWKPVRQLRQILCNQRHANLVSARLVITSNVKAWSPISGICDLLDDLGPHQFDLLRYVFDQEIVAISARWTDREAIQMHVRLTNGIMAECQAAYSSVSQESITVQCKSRGYRMCVGSERLQPADGPIRCFLDVSDAVTRRVCGRRTSMHSSFEAQVASFVTYVRNGVTPEPGLADGIAVTRAIEAARCSADRNGTEVLL